MSRYDITGMTESDLVNILKAYSTMDATAGQTRAWDIFTIGGDGKEGLLEVGPDGNAIEWEDLPRHILVEALREGENIFGKIDDGGVEVDLDIEDDYDDVDDDEELDLTDLAKEEIEDALDIEIEDDDEADEEDDEELELEEVEEEVDIKILEESNYKDLPSVKIDEKILKALADDAGIDFVDNVLYDVEEVVGNYEDGVLYADEDTIKGIKEYLDETKEEEVEADLEMDIDVVEESNDYEEEIASAEDKINELQAELDMLSPDQFFSEEEYEAEVDNLETLLMEAEGELDRVMAAADDEAERYTEEAVSTRSDVDYLYDMVDMVKPDGETTDGLGFSIKIYSDDGESNWENIYLDNADDIIARSIGNEVKFTNNKTGATSKTFRVTNDMATEYDLVIGKDFAEELGNSSVTEEEDMSKILEEHANAFAKINRTAEDAIGELEYYSTAKDEAMLEGIDIRIFEESYFRKIKAKIIKLF
jgi:hypothetical protein